MKANRKQTAVKLTASKIGTCVIVQAPVVQRLDNAIHRINRYPADKC